MIAAIDFEIATPQRHTPCSVGIVTFDYDGSIIDEYYTLIKPPQNRYSRILTNIHGITPEMTEDAKAFPEILPIIMEKLKGKTIISHSSFDKVVLKQTMEYHNLKSRLLIWDWIDTVELCRKAKLPAKLNEVCGLLNIKLKHHNALADSLACGMVYFALK